MTDFQRIGSVSNSHVGNDFERIVSNFFALQGIILSKHFKLPIGIGEIKKTHAFDLGSSNPLLIVECKSHTWTSGNNTPSAKMTVWNEAMYYFSIAPSEYRKVFMVLRDFHNIRKITLAEYYMKTYIHLIPIDVEIWEYDNTLDVAKRL